MNDGIPPAVGARVAAAHGAERHGAVSPLFMAVLIAVIVVLGFGGLAVVALILPAVSAGSSQFGESAVVFSLLLSSAWKPCLRGL